MSWNRPVNVDLRCSLRVMGFGKASFVVETDEGDGYDFIQKYMEGEGPNLKPHHFEEWAEQLNNISDWCRAEAERLKIADKPSETTVSCKIENDSEVFEHLSNWQKVSTELFPKVSEECKKYQIEFFQNLGFENVSVRDDGKVDGTKNGYDYLGLSFTGIATKYDIKSKSVNQSMEVKYDTAWLTLKSAGLAQQPNESLKAKEIK